MMRLLADLVLGLCASPGRTCLQSDVLFARVRGGVFELLSAAAWARALGYAQDELSGKPLRELMQLEKNASSRFAAALLDHEGAQPLDITLRCKDERRKSFRLHRRVDPYDDAIYLLADELPEPAITAGQLSSSRSYSFLTTA